MKYLERRRKAKIWKIILGVNAVKAGATTRQRSINSAGII